MTAASNATVVKDERSMGSSGTLKKQIALRPGSLLPRDALSARDAA
jgi:hypothetical protein